MSERPRSRTVAIIVTAAAALGALLAGCTSSAPHTGSTTAAAQDGVQRVTIKAGDDYRFHPSTITIHPGKVRIVLVNDGKGAPHNWQLPNLPVGDWVPLTVAGQSAQVTFTAPAPGTYQFVCSIHLRQGQTGELIVLPN
ncbi:MAG: cupredoxin domain-containing protein [Jatrophihabitantaceae bacterium]